MLISFQNYICNNGNLYTRDGSLTKLKWCWYNVCVRNVLQNEIIQRVLHKKYILILKLSLFNKVFIQVQNCNSLNFRQCIFEIKKLLAWLNVVFVLRINVELKKVFPLRVWVFLLLQQFLHSSLAIINIRVAVYGNSPNYFSSSSNYGEF